MIDLEVINAGTVETTISSLSQTVRQRLRSVIGTQTIALRESVRSKISSIFKPGTGRLSRSIGNEIAETPADVTGTVYSRGVPYARIQEYGGQTRPHVILPRNASVLAFMGRDGKMVFAKRVNHPGSNIPARPFMRSTLAERRLEIIGAIRSAVGDAVKS